MDVYAGFWFTLGVMATVAVAYEYDPDYLVPPKCKPCDAKSCPQLTYCAGKVVKDHCGCCPRCSSDLFQPHVSTAVSGEKQEDNACQKRQCPKFKVCMTNIQGLPICTCPSLFVCNRRRGKREKERNMVLKICGTDGVTYESRCHMRIANCNSSKRIKRNHNGQCKTNDVLNKVPMISTEEIKKEIDAQEEREKQKQIERMERANRKKLKRKKMKDRRKRKEKKERKARERQNRKSRRMKRRNNGFSVYSSRYRHLLGKHTKWGKSQVRKSRI